MTDMTMRERIARAIAEAHELHGRSYYSMADAVLAAMREPTPQMLIDAGTMSGYGEADEEFAHSDSDHIGWWQAMIDAAISEGET
jgi:lipoate synthase